MSNSLLKMRQSRLLVRSFSMVRGILLAFAVFGIVYALEQQGVLIPNAGSLYLVAVVYATFAGDTIDGLLTSVSSMFFILLEYKINGNLIPLAHVDQNRLVVLGISFVTVTLLVGTLKRMTLKAIRVREQAEAFKSFQKDINNLFTNVPAIVLVTKSEDHILELANPLAEKEFGTNIQGRPAKEALKTFFRKEHLELLDKAYKTGEEVVISEVLGLHDTPESGLKYFSSVVRPVKDANNKVFGLLFFLLDISKRKMAEEEVMRSRNELGVILSSITDGITVQDISGRLIYANDAAAEQTGFISAGQMLSATPEEIKNRYDLVDENLSPFIWNNLPGRKILLGQPPSETVVGFKQKPSGKIKWALVKSGPVKDVHGKVTMAINIFRDITADRESEENLKRAAKRQEYLAKAGALLSSSLNYETTLSSIAKLAVPDISDWAAIDMLLEDGSLKRIAVEHQDPKKVEYAYELQKKYPVDMSEETGLPKVLKEGVTEFYPSISDELLVASAKDSDQLNLLREIGLTAVVIVPLKVLDKVVGAITFVNADSKRDFTNEDKELAEELARRASIAIQNAKLYEQAREMAVKEHNQTVLLDSLLTTAPVGFAFITPQMEISRLNSALAKMFGLSASGVVGKNFDEICGPINPLLSEHVRYVLESGQSLLNQEVSGKSPNSPETVSHWMASYFPIFSENLGLAGVGVVMDETTMRKKAQEEVLFYASHDILTGLPNRKVFEERLDSALEKAGSSSASLAVLFLDLDRFKNINDTLGHSTGDAIIIEMAGRIRNILSPEDTVARWGGDEFVVLLPDIKGNYEATRAAEKILKVFENPIRIENQTLHIGTSIGIAVYPQDGQTIQMLLKNADTALYRAKEAGKSRYQLYNEAMNFKASEKLALENQLRHALEKNEFRLFYQPVINLKTNKVVGSEALIRWQNPQAGLLKPHQFIPLAEELGLIVPIGMWVLRTACQQNKLWHDQGYTNLGVAVNLSTRQFLQEDLVEAVRFSLEESGLPANFLEMEITESVAMENIDTSRNKLQQLSELGVKITIDDFGTGYSSLSYLKNFPVSKLKIDKSFVRHCITNEQDSKIIRAIISMADSLNLKVVAEGVDTESQMALLRSLGCDAAQGYLISRPLKTEDFSGWLSRQFSPAPVVAAQELKNTPE